MANEGGVQETNGPIEWGGECCPGSGQSLGEHRPAAWQLGQCCCVLDVKFFFLHSTFCLWIDRADGNLASQLPSVPV